MKQIPQEEQDTKREEPTKEEDPLPLLNSEKAFNIGAERIFLLLDFFSFWFVGFIYTLTFFMPERTWDNTLFESIFN